jgi:hypothetical protein
MGDGYGMTLLQYRLESIEHRDADEKAPSLTSQKHRPPSPLVRLAGDGMTGVFAI